MLQRRKIVSLLVSISLSQSISSPSLAGTMDEAIVSPERHLAEGLTKLLSVLPALQEAITRITAPQERAQFRRGLEELERQVAELLRSKRRIIGALSTGMVDTGGLRASGERLQSSALMVKGALAFISPIHYDYVFGPDTSANAENGQKRDSLRKDFYEMEDLLERSLSVKGAAATLLIYAGIPGSFDVKRVVDSLRSSETALVAAQTCIRKTLGELKLSIFTAGGRSA